MSTASIPRTASGQWAEADDDYDQSPGVADLLSVVATSWQPCSQDAHTNFLSACKADADAHAGVVSVNRVRQMLKVVDIEHHQFSALWSHYTGVGRPMRRLGRWEPCVGSTSRNNSRPMPLRMWVGTT